MTDQTTQAGWTASFATMSEMQRAYRHLRYCSILSRTDPHRGDNRLHILVPTKSTVPDMVKSLAAAGFTFRVLP
jgi:hypothetical protein